MAEALAPETIDVEGRKFQSVSQKITAAQDDYLLGYLRQAGCTDVLASIQRPGAKVPTEGPSKEQQDALSQARAELLLTRILTSEYVGEILAGILTEVGTKWRYRTADANAEFFRDVTDTESKVRLREAVVAFVLGFFLFGGASSPTSPKSSNQSATAPDTSNAEVATSGNSPELSAKLVETTSGD